MLMNAFARMEERKTNRTQSLKSFFVSPAAPQVKPNNVTSTKKSYDDITIKYF